MIGTVCRISNPMGIVSVTHLSLRRLELSLVRQHPPRLCATGWESPKNTADSPKSG